MGKNNAIIYTFNGYDEDSVLTKIYSKLYRLAHIDDNLAVVFVNLSDNKYNIFTINDMTPEINCSLYSEYDDYSLDELDSQISLIYNDYYKLGKEWDTMAIIIHDSLKLSDCDSIEELENYINNKLNILDVLKLYVYFTVEK